MSKNATFKEGDIVFAKVKGYPAWPAKVIAAGSGKYPVLFFGTNESANCKGQDVFPFTEFKEKFGKNSKPAFLKAMKEANEAILAGEGGEGTEEEEEGNNSNKRRKRSDSAAKGKKGGKKEESSEEESEEEVPKKKAKPTPKPKKGQAAKKTPAKRAAKKNSKSDGESDENEPLSKAASSKTATKGTAARASRGGGRRRGTKVISYADKGSDDSEKEDKKKPQSSKRKKVKSESEASASGDSSDSKNSDSENEGSPKSSASDSDGESPPKPSKKAPPNRKSQANKNALKPKRATPARKGPAAKKKVAESSDGEESDKDSDKASEKSSHSSSASSTSSSTSSGSSSSGSHQTEDEEKKPDAKGDSIKSSKDDKETIDEKGQPEQTQDPKAKEKLAVSKSEEAEGLALSKEHVTDLPDARPADGQQEESATNSSVEDDEVIHSSRAHKSHSKHAVLSESDSDDEGKPKGEKGLEEMLEERKKEHQELKLKRRQEKMEERRRRQEAREKEQEEERKQKEEKKKQHQQRIRTEKRIRDLDDIIKRSLAVSTKDVPKCIDAMNELDNLTILAAMLVKYPAIIDTLKKCRKYKADCNVMTKADSLCNKLRDIAASDRTAITALNKQKSDKQKTKKEEINENKPDGKTQEVTPSADSTLEAQKVPAPDIIKADSTSDSSLQPTTTQSDNLDQPSQEVDMDIDNDTQVTSSTNIIDTRNSGDHTQSAHDSVDSIAPTDSHELTTMTQTLADAEHSKDSVTVDTDLAWNKPASIPMVDSVSDLKAMAKDELPSEDALTAGIQALIANAQESTAMLDQVIKQKKDKRMSSSSSKKRRKLDSGLHHHESTRSSQLHKHSSSGSRSSVTVTKSASPTKPVEKLSKLPARKTADYDDLDIHDLLGI
ncbi:hepatoma-derived growth factor-related protein 2-like isoform X2 [Watersipora subatra]|uniref:hepatoma-derived growth factor-related protein 2-like isoform X2 n=1 Tax=Watersipora subatra TaxID=2589382 RepID=UPI00355C16A8